MCKHVVGIQVELLCRLALSGLVICDDGLVAMEYNQVSDAASPCAFPFGGLEVPVECVLFLAQLCTGQFGQLECQLLPLLHTFGQHDAVLDEVLERGVNSCTPLSVYGRRLNDIALDFEVVELTWARLECVELAVRPSRVCHVVPMRLCPNASFDGWGFLFVALW